MSVQIVKYGKLFERNPSGKQVKCTLCDCWLPSSADKFLESHVIGRKHKQQAEKVEKKNAIFKRSIYVKGFEPKLEDLEEKLAFYFTEMEVEVEDVYIDKNSGSYAIIRLSNEDAVRQVLSQSTGMFHGAKLVIKERQNGPKFQSKTDENSDTCNKSPKNLLPLSLVELLRIESRVSDQMRVLQSFYELKPEDNKLRKLICELIQSVAEEAYPNSKVVMFGSSVNGLGVLGCDIDMTILFTEELTDEDFVLHNTRNILERFAPGCKNVTLVETSRTCKLIKFYHTEGKISIDLSLNNRLALANTELLRTYMSLHPNILPLLFTLRLFLKSHKLIGRASNQISSYAATIMFLHYLQQKFELPCLQSCNHHYLERGFIENWNCNFCKECTLSSGTEKIIENDTGAILRNFFTYVVNFDYCKNVISIHTSKIQTRTQILEEAINDGYSDLLKTDRELVIQDPFKRAHNITQNLSKDGLQKLKEILGHGADKMKIVNEDLLELFTPIDTVKPRVKQKQQRNRSNVYSINLPDCKHCSSEKQFYCFTLIEKLLQEDLRMHACIDNKDKLEKEIDPKSTSSVDAISNSDVEKDDVVKHTSQRKRKLSGSNQDIDFIIKKQKKSVSDQDIEDQSISEVNTESKIITYIVRAYADTWTNRRKQRRLLNKIKTRDNEPFKVAIDCNEAEDKDSGVKLSESTDFVELGACSGRKNESKELLSFKLILCRASESLKLCKVTLIPYDITNNLQDFQTFFAFFKKELLMKMNVRI